MKRSLKKCGGRKKAFLGADGAISAAATLAAAAMNAVATNQAAKTQADAVKENAKVQSQSIKEQTENNNNLQQESINFTRQQNQENRQQQQDIQTTLQMLAGQDNMNDRLRKTKVMVKYGGRPKKRLKSASPFYGGANAPFTVTDGGGVVPIQVDNNGYGLYEIYGNDHEHYHKTNNGKSKSGVGFRFSDGSVVEGEGNQNSNRGEQLYVTPDDALFISKHSIDGFNPAKAVDAGMHPVEAFQYQEAIKNAKGYNDDGSKKRKKLRNTATIGTKLILDSANQTQYPSNNTGNIVAGASYLNTTSPVEDINIRQRSLKQGGRVKYKTGGAPTWWDNYGGATINSAGNVLGAGIGILGNYFAGRGLNKAYTKAGNMLADAYSQMHGIDMSEIDRNSYNPAHAMAVVKSADTNINPQLERLRRNASAERTLVNNNTLSSAARQQRLAGINDRMYQRMGDLYADKYNKDNQIAQANAERITEVSKTNAALDVEASKDYAKDRLALLQYNNDIENEKIMGMAGAKADALTQNASTNAQYLTNSAGLISSALTKSGSAFSDAFNTVRTREYNFDNIYAGANLENQVSMAITKGLDDNVNTLESQITDMISAEQETGNPNQANIEKWTGYLRRLQAYKNKSNS